MTAGLKSVEGQVTAIDPGAHKVTVKTRDGQHHELIWGAGLHDRMSKLQQWWFTKITAEESGGVWKVTAQDFFKRPDDWPFQKGGAGKPFVPRNEKLIVVQVLIKAYSDLWMNTNTPDQVLFEDAREDILKAVEKDIDRVMKIGGA